MRGFMHRTISHALVTRMILDDDTSCILIPSAAASLLSALLEGNSAQSQWSRPLIHLGILYSVSRIVPPSATHLWGSHLQSAMKHLTSTSRWCVDAQGHVACQGAVQHCSPHLSLTLTSTWSVQRLLKRSLHRHLLFLRLAHHRRQEALMVETCCRRRLCYTKSKICR